MAIAIDGRYIQDHFPGVGRYLFNLLRAMARLTEEAMVVLWNRHAVNTRFDLFSLSSENRLVLWDAGVAAVSAWEQAALPWAFRRRGISLFHSPFYIKPYLSSLPSVVTIHDLIPLLHPQYVPAIWSRVVYPVLLRLALRSDRIIVPSSSTRADLVRLTGLPEAKIQVIYYAADRTYRQLDKPSLEDVRHKYQLPRRFVLYVGTHKPHKKIGCLIEAYARIQRETDADLVLAGPPDPKWAVEMELRAIQRLGVGNRVHLLGTVPEEDLPKLYNLAEVFVFPSLYEGFGLPVLEAMACGLPVVCSNSSSLPEVVGNGGMLVEPRDPAALAEALAGVLNDRALREKMAAASLAQAQRFSWEKAAQETLSVYREVLGR